MTSISKARWMFLLTLFVGSAFAQVGTSMMTGKIVDATGAAIPDAEVKVANEESGSTVLLRTNGEGIYRAPALIPGKYRVEVGVAGFDPQARKNIVVEVAQTLAVD